jgi:hypothetical protein
MRFLLSTLIIIFLSYLAGLFLPWWSIAIIAFIVALLIPHKPGLAFLSGFLGIFIMWALVALWLNIENESLLSAKVAQLMQLGESPFLLILVTAFIGALVGGFAAMSGSLLRNTR